MKEVLVSTAMTAGEVGGEEGNAKSNRLGNKNRIVMAIFDKILILLQANAAYHHSHQSSKSVEL